MKESQKETKKKGQLQAKKKKKEPKVVAQILTY